MLSNDRKTYLAERVALALKTKDNHQKQLTCTECGRGYLGRADSGTCGEACRKAKQR